MSRKLWQLVCWVDAHRYEVAVGLLVVGCVIGLHLTDRGLPD